VDQNLPEDALVIAPYSNDPAFLYQTNRYGWTAGGKIEQRIAQGADYYVTTSLESEAQELMTNYQTVISNEQFTVIDLNQPLEASKAAKTL
ncbi:MAG: hypothetical protein Q4G02_04355, partial [bacterium]|nr:hypothetical protein [bacterium]